MSDSTIPTQPQILAEAVAQEMYSKDRASQMLGMKIVEMRPGYSRVIMTIHQNMLNGHGSCHGGFIFSLADSAFAFACNSHNHVTVAAGCSIDFLAPGREGDVLTAEAKEQSLAGRTGVYDVDVTNQNGHRVAMFRGRSHRISGEVLPSPGSEASKTK